MNRTKRVTLWSLLGVLFVLFSAYLYLASQGNRVVIQHLTIDVAGTKREYRLVVPVAGRSDSKVPLLIALHGALDTTDEMAQYTQLDKLAAEKGFLLVYLQGRLLNWPPSIPEENPNFAVPDFEFFDAVCDRLIEEHGVDPERIYLAGVSQGGGMCNLIVAHRSERIAAALCNCGWIPPPYNVVPFDTKHKCPMLFVVGALDKQVPRDTVLAASRVFEQRGHPIDFFMHSGGHGWNHELGVNQVLWRFLENKKCLGYESSKTQKIEQNQP